LVGGERRVGYLKGTENDYNQKLRRKNGRE